jgi:fucose 4-O-acetylase-like acetyltransferase
MRINVRDTLFRLFSLTAFFCHFLLLLLHCLFGQLTERAVNMTNEVTRSGSHWFARYYFFIFVFVYSIPRNFVMQNLADIFKFATSHVSGKLKSTVLKH